MSTLTDQISATSKSQFESQLDFLNSVLTKAVDGAQQVAALNLNTARGVAERGATAARQLADAKDPHQVLDVVRPLATLDGVLAYGRELFSIASSTHVQLLQVARDQLRVPALPSALSSALPVAAAPALVLAAPAPVETIESKVESKVEQAAAPVVEQVAETANVVAAAAADVEEAGKETIEQTVAAVAETVPAAATSVLYDGEPAGVPKNARTKAAAKSVAEAVATLADKPATTLKSVTTGKPRKS